MIITCQSRTSYCRAMWWFIYFIVIKTTLRMRNERKKVEYGEEEPFPQRNKRVVHSKICSLLWSSEFEKLLGWSRNLYPRDKSWILTTEWFLYWIKFSYGFLVVVVGTSPGGVFSLFLWLLVRTCKGEIFCLLSFGTLHSFGFKQLE